MREHRAADGPAPSLRARLAELVFERTGGESSASNSDSDFGSPVAGRDAEDFSEGSIDAAGPGGVADTAADDDGTSGSNGVDRRSRTDLVEGFVAAVDRCADGDLSVRVDVPEDPEMAPLAESLNRLFAEWHEAMAGVDVFTEQVAASTERVAGSVADGREASRTVAESVDDIARGATEQSESIGAVADEMRDLSATVEEVASSADEIAAATDDAAARGRRTRDAAEEAIDGLDAIDEQTRRTVSQVESLNGLIDEITGVVTRISDIADQTNILALNASIEAARADEAGAGFAVVAEEVKTLAEETAEATEDIEAAIDEIRAQSAETVEGIGEARERVAAESGTIEEALGSLDRIVEDVTETNASVREISDATDSQAATAQEVVGQTDEVGAISEETAAGATTVASSARRQTTSLSEAMTSVNALAEQADVLRATLDGYDLDGATATTAATSRTAVDFWHGMSGSKAILLEEFAAEFNESNPDVRVEMSPKGSYRGAFEATMAAARSGSPPTVAQVFEVGTQRALDSGVFTPVESVLPSEASTDDLVPAIANYYRDDGTLWSMPFNSSNPVLYYNAEAFERAGLDPENPPETFDELTAAAERVVERGVADYGATWANYGWFLEQWFAAAGRTLVDAENGRSGRATTSNLTSDTGERVLRWWADLARSGLLFDAGIEARGKAREAFLDGDAAMLVDSSSTTLSVVEGAEERGFTAAVGKFPAPGEREGVVVGGASLWVAEDAPAREQEAAGRFLAWLTEPEQQRRWHQRTGYFPVHADAERMLRREGWFDEHPAFAVAFEQLNETRDSPATRGARIGPFSTVRSIVSEGVSELVAGREVERTLREMDEQVTYRLSEYAGAEARSGPGARSDGESR
ncbi:extracellular solute-binding protein [Halogeometricum luteum]|uniref:Extracellular solute-binding protein n=1 Tax=Halogeometricum luteum TaxID=2950537 RepID=A0ABU2G2R3_9EURY|nr:extracellular solute-binding protein [Halogeometricum sp. S3BR5-2]MDS0295080.1 extracellular solute-binding protein [Halogeometricum sp. S3BR5-2]